MNLMTRIYLDNAATSWPKPSVVYEAVDRYQRELGAPAGRGSYREATEVERLVLESRRRVGQCIGATEPRRILFTYSGTDSLNLALHGLLRPGDHVVTSMAEHNSTLRPLRWLEAKQGVQVTRVRCGRDGVVDPDDYRRAIRPNTRLISLVHASNVTGAIQPVCEVGRLATQHGLRFLVDAAQSLGHLAIDFAETQADLLAAPGHKGLLGPLGTGVLAVAAGIESELEPIRQGGTGTDSESDTQPLSLPDLYEAGNHNMPGIAGLNAALGFLLDRGLQAIRHHELELTERLISGLRDIRGTQVYGPLNPTERLGVVSFTVAGYDPQEVAALLDSSYSIQVRAGFHCAPLMHQALGTADRGGTIRVSIGPFNTTAEVDATVVAVAEIAAAA